MCDLLQGEEQEKSSRGTVAWKMTRNDLKARRLLVSSSKKCTSERDD